MRDLKKFSFIFILFLSFQNSLQFNLFDSFSLIAKTLDPAGFLFQLIKIRLSQMEDDFSCTLCKRLVAAVRTTVEEKYTPDDIMIMNIARITIQTMVFHF